MSRLRRITIALALILPAAGLAAPASASAGEFHGINAQRLFDLPQSQWDGHLSTLSRSGVKLVRRDAPWGAAEPAPPVGGRHTYNWAFFDRQVEALARHGMRWLPIIDYSAGWAAAVPGDPFTPPARISDYTAYATALVRRYGPNGSFWAAHPSLPRLPVNRWEVWNEPNVKLFWHPQGDAPERYADLYAATRSSLKAVDGSARVIVAGLALANPTVIDQHDFVNRMYRHRPDLRGRVDAVALHPYSPTVAGVHAEIKEMRETLARNGAGSVPLEITELGWTTKTASESYRAAALGRLASELMRSDCGVVSMIPHTWLTREINTSDPEDWFGIANTNGSLKPSGSAYLNAVSSVTRSGAGARMRICGGSGGSDGSAAGRGGRLSLQLKVKGSRRSRRMNAAVRCPGGCRLRLELFRRGRRGKAARGRAIARRSVSLGSRRRVVAVRLPRGRRSLLLRAVARNREGASVTNVRKLAVRCRKSRGRWACAVRRR